MNKTHEPDTTRLHSAGKWLRTFGPLGLALGCTVGLGLVAGPRLTTDTAAVIIGVVVGIVASVPVSLLFVALLSRRTASFVRPAPPPALPATSATFAPVRRGPPPVAPDKVRVLLGQGIDGGIPTNLDFGGTDAAANLLVVNASDVYFTVTAAAEQAGWAVEPIETPEELADWARTCQDRLATGMAAPRTVLALDDLADLLTNDPRQVQEANHHLHYLIMHGPGAGLHMLAGVRRPDALLKLNLATWPVRIAGPYQTVAALAASLDLTCDDAAGLLTDDAGAHWLRARDIWLGFHPTGGPHGA